MATERQALRDGLWILEGDRITMYAIPFSTRMAVAKLRTGGLWLWSPVGATPERLAAVAELGPVEHILAPNKLHHLFLPAWVERFPQARLWAPPGLAERRPDLPFTDTLGDGPPREWADDLDQVLVGGSRVLQEVVFFHRPSKTTILTDIVQNHDPNQDGWFWRTVKRMAGIVAPNGSAPRDYRLTVTDRAAARAAVRRILAWPAQSVVLAHGLNVTDDAPAFLRRAFAWLHV